MKNLLLTLAILTATLTATGQTMSREAASLVARGDSCMRMNDTYNSMLCYEQALLLGSSDTVMYKLAQCYFKRGQYVKCLALTDTLMVDTVMYQHIKLRYNCLQKMGASDSLWIDCAQRLVAINPMDAAVVADIATYYNGKQLADTALSYCRTYYALDSTNQQVNKQMARALFIKKDYYPALDFFLDAYRNGDENPALLFYIGRTYECYSNFEKAHDFMLMAAEKSSFASLPIVKALARVSNNSEYRDDVLNYTQMAFELCRADSASMAEVYDIQAKFYEAYFYHYCSTDYQKARTCVANQVRTLKSALSYEPTISRQYNMAIAYGRMHDRDNERLWLQKIKESDSPRTKANRSIFEYVDYRLDKLKEDEFFEGGKKSDGSVEIVKVED